jgi:hypothetical protein
MHTMILIHCFLLFLLVGAILVLLLWNAPEDPNDTLSLKDKLLLASGCVCGFVILHLHWTMLPWHRTQVGDTVAFSSFVLLATVYVLPAFYWVFSPNPTKHPLNALQNPAVQE